MAKINVQWLSLLSRVYCRQFWAQIQLHNVSLGFSSTNNDYGEINKEEYWNRTLIPTSCWWEEGKAQKGGLSIWIQTELSERTGEGLWREEREKYVRWTQILTADTPSLTKMWDTQVSHYNLWVYGSPSEGFWKWYSLVFPAFFGTHTWLCYLQHRLDPWIFLKFISPWLRRTDFVFYLLFVTIETRSGPGTL